MSDDLKKARERLLELPEDKQEDLALDPLDPWQGRGKWTDEEKRRKAACPWREALEQESGSDKSVYLLAAIRKELRKKDGEYRGGAWPTPMGALVVGAEETLKVLGKESSYSVREYWKRMNEVHMPMHLGLDANPAPGQVRALRGPDRDWAAEYPKQINPGDYEGDSVANRYIYRVGRAEAFCRALEATRLEFQKAEDDALVDAMKLRALPGSAGPRPDLRVTVDLWGFAERVIAELSRHWFAIPDGKYMLLGGEPEEPEDEKAYCPSDFVLFSRYVFRPDPDEHVQMQAAVRGEKVMQAATRAIREKGAAHPFLQYLMEPNNPGTDVVARRAVGAIDGFVAANWGSFLRVARKWLEGDLWRIQREHQDQIADLRAEAAELEELLDEYGEGPLPREDERLTTLEDLLADTEPLLTKVIGVLLRDPVPAWLHRFAVAKEDLNGTPIQAGERMIVNLGRAATDAAKQTRDPAAAADILFGGNYEERVDGARKYLHACPGKALAMGVLMGMLVGLLELRDVRKESTVTINFPPRGIRPPAPPPAPPPAVTAPQIAEASRLSVEDHRIWIGRLGFLLPVVSYFVAGIFPGGRPEPWYPLSNVSEYYHTSAVAIFCGMLVAMSGFLITYRGFDKYDKWDERVTSIAAVSSALVAFFPTELPPKSVANDPWWPGWAKYVHLTAAAVMFVCLIILAVWLFRWSLDENGKTRPRYARPIEKRFRDDLCLLAALIMSASIGWLAGGYGAPIAKTGLNWDWTLVRGPIGAWSAVVLMLLCALLSISRFRSSAREEREAAGREAAEKPDAAEKREATEKQHDRIGWWLVGVAAVAGFFGCLLARPWLLEGKLNTLILLVPEVVAIWAFAISWIVKSQHRNWERRVDRLRRLLARLGWRYVLPLP